jgi:hypothetical protein
VYYYLKANTGLSAGFISFLPRYWNIRFSLLSFPYFLEPSGQRETFSVLHLWFLVFLLVYTLFLLPLFLYLRNSAGKRLAQRFSGFLAGRFALFLWAVPIALLEGFLGAIWPSGWNRWIWPFIIVIGYYVVQQDWPALVKFWMIFLGSLTATLLVYELLVRRIGVLRLLFGMRDKKQTRRTDHRSSDLPRCGA